MLKLVWFYICKGVDIGIILKEIPRNWMWGCELDSSDSLQGPVGSACEQGHGSSCSIKRVELLDKLSDYQLLKKDTSSFGQLQHQSKRVIKYNC
jgi:hypothetical protein